TAVNDSALLVEAHFVTGITCVTLGQLTKARRELEKVRACYDPEKHRFNAFLYGSDPGVFSSVFLSFVLWILGHPDLALRTSEEAEALARKVSHPFSHTFALYYAARVHQYRGEVELALDKAKRVVELAEQQAFDHLRALGMMVRGWARAESG